MWKHNTEETSEAEQHCNQINKKNGNKPIKNSIKHSNKCADGGERQNSN